MELQREKLKSLSHRLYYVMKVFARPASGLVRTISATVYNLLVMAPTAVYIYGIWAASLFPGVNLPDTVVVAVPVCIIIGLFYAIFSIIMPRSGGDYIWVSRTLHPILGFMANFFLFIVIVSLIGVEIPWAVGEGLVYLFRFLGQEGVATVISTPVTMFILGAIYFTISAIIVALGTRVTMWALRVLLTMVIIGFLTFVSIMLAAGSGTFISNFDAMSGTTYAEIMDAAIKAGYPAKFVLSATLLGIIYTILNFLGFNFTVYVAGEVKEVRKTQIISIIGAIIIFGFITWATYAVAYHVFNPHFLGALSYLYTIGDPAYKLNFPPYFHNLLTFVTKDPILLSIVFWGWAMMPLAAGLTYMFASVRMLFAWSFDRILPTAISAVDRRFNTPYIALIIVVILAFIFQYLWLFTPVMKYFIYITAGWMICQSIAAIAGIMFPYRRKDLFETAPSIAKAKVRRIPLLTILGVAVLIISIWLGYAAMTPVFVGAIDPIAVAFTYGMFIVGIVIYIIASMYRRRTGIPLELSFKEIPPE